MDIIFSLIKFNNTSLLNRYKEKYAKKYKQWKILNELIKVKDDKKIRELINKLDDIHIDNDKVIKHIIKDSDNIDLIKYIFEELKITFDYEILIELLISTINNFNHITFEYLITKGVNPSKVYHIGSVVRMCIDEGHSLMLKSLLKYYNSSSEQIYNYISDAIYDNNFDIFKVLMEHTIEKFNKETLHLFIKRIFPKIWHKIKYVSDETMQFFSYINSLDKDFYPNYKIANKEEIERSFNNDLKEKIRKIDKYLKEENQI